MDIHETDRSTDADADIQPRHAPSTVPASVTRFSGPTFTKAPAVRAGIGLGVALVVAVGSAVAMGASPASPSTGIGAAPQAAPSGSADPGRRPKDKRGFGPGGIGGLPPGFLKPDRGGRGFGQISITAISGSDITLTTVDGWTRTVHITAGTVVTRGGAAAKAADLKVGDRIRFRQAKQADGTFTISAIDIVLPRVVGTIADASASTVTITDRDGATVTVHLGAATTIRVRGKDAATAADLTKGMIVVAVGERRSDGSVDATAVVAGKLGGRDKGPKPDRQKDTQEPEASDGGG